MTHARPSWALRTRVGLGVAALCLAAPTVQVAAAEDGPALPATPELAVAAVEEAVEATLETVSALPAGQPGLVVPPAAPPPATVTHDPAVPAVAPPEAAAEPESPPQSASAPAAAVSTPPPPGEPTAPAPAPDPPSPAADQVQPVNVNVSVRVDSPGDNGSVTQVNAATVEVSAPTTAVGAEQYQPASTQYQPAQSGADAPSHGSSSTPAADEPGWTWTWTCGGSVTDVLPAGGSTTSLPANWSWNWNWNCGDDETTSGNSETESAGQYHPGVTQYQPVNLNVSIRIGSAGNDGPVTQTNMAVVIVSPPVIVALPPLQVPIPTLPAASSSPSASAASPASDPTGAAAILAAELASVEVAVSTEAADAIGDWIFRGPAGPFGVDAAASESPELSARPPASRVAAAERSTTGLPSNTSALTLRAVAVVHAQESVQADRRAAAKPRRKPTRRPVPPTRAPVLASGFAGAAPGGSDGGGWPLIALLLVPFSLALVDSARRMGREATRPAAAAHRSRRERPG